MEIWKPVVGHEWFYEVSNLWNIKSLNFRHKGIAIVLKPQRWRYYMYVNLHNDSIQKKYSVHRLVAKAFIPNPENKPQINHINGLKHDNRIENLEWCTHSENMIHKYRILWVKHTERQIACIKEWWLKRRKKILQYTKSLNLVCEFDSLYEASIKTWANYSNISLCASWKRKTTGWFIWKYKDL